MRDYLTSVEVLALHHALIERYGGARGIRDMGAVETAVFRPQCGYYADIAEEAAALLESLLINHPFVDGNKRVAFAACDVFLRINGQVLHAEPDWIYQRMMAWIENPTDRFEQIVQDIRVCLIKNW
ncbi:MAG: type II toxin-antitoxin system death-on-curing family toxin [Deltaproteobacteria bacterium]|jgi:death-on-curing protein|nr:type II toxin-antitoxin system death-on-curing family toxin [Deltaproteobacteria bacterium]